LLGLTFAGSGLNGFSEFLPLPEVPPAGRQFLAALAASGYVLPLVKAVELVAGLMLVSGCFVPLGLVLLAPVVVNIAAFHLLVVPRWPIALLVVAGEVMVAWHHRDAFRPILRFRSR
jgi:uncharacterized membrane protein YphA (DoxX/SURF4 family)